MLRPDWLSLDRNAQRNVAASNRLKERACHREYIGVGGWLVRNAG